MSARQLTLFDSLAKRRKLSEADSEEEQGSRSSPSQADQALLSGQCNYVTVQNPSGSTTVVINSDSSPTQAQTAGSQCSTSQKSGTSVDQQEIEASGVSLPSDISSSPLPSDISSSKLPSDISSSPFQKPVQPSRLTTIIIISIDINW